MGRAVGSELEVLGDLRARLQSLRLHAFPLGFFSLLVYFFPLVYVFCRVQQWSEREGDDVGEEEDELGRVLMGLNVWLLGPVCFLCETQWSLWASDTATPISPPPIIF